MKTHAVNITYLVLGLVFLGTAGSWALRQAGVIDLGQARWLLPLVLVVSGVVGLGAAAARGVRAHRRDSQVLDPGQDPDLYHYDTHYDSEGELR